MQKSDNSFLAKDNGSYNIEGGSGRQRQKTDKNAIIGRRSSQNRK